MRGINGVRGTTGRAVKGVVPFCGDLSASRDWDDGLGHGCAVGVDTTIADDIVGVDVFYGLYMKCTSEKENTIECAVSLTPL